jgi:hypothetical protein
MADPVIKFVGNPGDYHSGIPSRDLSLAEFDALSEDQQATVRVSRAYDYAGAIAAARAGKAPAKDAAEITPSKAPSA